MFLLRIKCSILVPIFLLAFCTPACTKVSQLLGLKKYPRGDPPAPQPVVTNTEPVTSPDPEIATPSPIALTPSLPPYPESLIHRNKEIGYFIPNQPNVTMPAYKGKRYMARVPDTLDLAERASLSVNGLTESTDPNADYETYWIVRLWNSKPEMSRQEFGWVIQPQIREALPLARLASGSMQNLQVEKRWLEVLFQSRNPDDGVFYYPIVGRPWLGSGPGPDGAKDLGVTDRFFDSWSAPNYMGIMEIYYRLTKSPDMLDYAKTMVDGIRKKMIHYNGMAFPCKFNDSYPTDAPSACNMSSDELLKFIDVAIMADTTKQKCYIRPLDDGGNRILCIPYENKTAGISHEKGGEVNSSETVVMNLTADGLGGFYGQLDQNTTCSMKFDSNTNIYAVTPCGGTLDGNYIFTDSYKFLAGNAGWTLRYLVAVYNTMKYQPAMDLADEIVNFLKKYGYIREDGQWTVANNSTGHNAGYLSGLIDYAFAKNDAALIQWTHQSFLSGLGGSGGDIDTGFFPEYPTKLAYDPGAGTGGGYGGTGETCQVAAMMDLAVKFSTAQIADYWEFVDKWVRNHFAESQLTSTAWMTSQNWGQPQTDPKDVTDVLSNVCKEHPLIHDLYVNSDDVGRKNIGNFASWPNPNDGYPGAATAPKQRLMMHCCSGVGNLSLYRVWSNMLHHFEDGRLRVNLLLNRASPWADIDSFIPYTGRVDIHVKSPVTLSVRIPNYVKNRGTSVTCTVNGVSRSLTWEGINVNYALVGSVAEGDEVSILFPLPDEETKEVKVAVTESTYTITLKGNDVVNITPSGNYWPYYQREHYRRKINQSVPVRYKMIERFVADDILMRDVVK